MGLINLLENEFELYGVRWKQEPDILTTDFGEKRVRYWKEKKKLEWHVKWRDESSKGSGAVPDRMIRTRDGEYAVFDGKHWVSLHDHADTPFGCQEVDRWGQFIGNLLSASIKSESPDGLCLEKSDFNFDHCLELTKKYMEGNFHFINTSIYEAKKRLEFSKALKKKVQKKEWPLLEKELCVNNGKRIFHFLFYQGGDSWPVVGYLPVRNFLYQWLEMTSPLSLKNLFTAINRHFPLDGEQGLLLLAEIVTPWELNDCINQLSNSNLEMMVEGLNKYESIWETNRVFLKTATEWFDENRRKVAL